MYPRQQQYGGHRPAFYGGARYGRGGHPMPMHHMNMQHQPLRHPQPVYHPQAAYHPRAMHHHHQFVGYQPRRQQHGMQYYPQR